MAKTFDSLTEAMNVAWVAQVVFGCEVVVGIGRSRDAATGDLRAAVALATQHLRAKGEPIPGYDVEAIFYESVQGLLMAGDGGPYLELLVKTAKHNSVLDISQGRFSRR